MRIATNVSAIVSNNALQKSQDRLTKSIARLSSGYKINSSSDDAAGYAISEKMRLQLRGLNQADNNAADGVSVLHTAEGAMEEIQSPLDFESVILQMTDIARMLEQLTESQRSRLVKHIFLGYTLQEIANQEGVSNQSVSASITAALKKLRSILEK